MHIDNIDILDFKNIRHASLAFSPAINCIVGNNGMGKSNLLEAIYYLSMTRSFLRLPDAEVINHQAEAMLLKASFSAPGSAPEVISIGYSPSSKKVLRKGGKEFKRMSAHIGSIPIVLASPADHSLIAGTPDDRRRLMDATISQADPLYMQALLDYNKALSQRNATIKAGFNDPIIFDGIEELLASAASRIILARQKFVNEIQAPLLDFYQRISGPGELPSISYAPSRPADAIRSALAGSRQRDMIIGHTTVGPHRDDLILSLNSRDLKRLGSQGQIKSFTIALRLALHAWLKRLSGKAPLLLLDDIFDKLDASRVANILSIIATDNLGQTFITDTGREHIDSLLQATPGSHLLLLAENGCYTTISSRQ